jgi:hypothetical protein
MYPAPTQADDLNVILKNAVLPHIDVTAEAQPDPSSDQEHSTASAQHRPAELPPDRPFSQIARDCCDISPANGIVKFERFVAPCLTKETIQ